VAVVRAEFEPVPSSARQARRFARETLEAHLEETAFVAEVLLSELATNVIRHARTPYVVELEVDGDWARVSVIDGAAVDLAILDVAVDAEAGRGLKLLERLADRWGVEHREGGKCVWFELRRTIGNFPPGVAPAR
jgi:anti-sigma regulatory factor (Ser/Thr protein kinase)